MAQVGRHPLGGQVHEDADTAGCRALDVQLSRAEKRKIAEAQRSGGRRREHGVEVVGSGEDDADDVVVVDAVAFEHLLQ